MRRGHPSPGRAAIARARVPSQTANPILSARRPAQSGADCTVDEMRSTQLDAAKALRGPIVRMMRIHIVDPSAYTPPYDHALCTALGLTGAEVTLFTSRFTYGPVPPAEAYRRREMFYRRAHAAAGRGGIAASRLGGPGAANAASSLRSRRAKALKLAEHLPDMLRYRAISSQADVIHFQWLPVQALDWMLLPRRAGGGGPRASRCAAPLLITAHDVMPHEPLPLQLTAQRLLYRHLDAVVVHSHHGRDRLVHELQVPAERVHVIPHGIFEHLRGGRALAEGESAARQRSGGRRGPVVLLFGLLRPYKGIDVLLAAWRMLSEQERMGGELWIAGMPRMDLHPFQLQRGAHWLGQGPPPPTEPPPPEGVRIAPRFIGDDELALWFEAADIVVLPYLEADQSGVLSTALAFGKPLLLTDVGGFPEIAARGAASIVPAGEPHALAGQLRLLLADPARREQLSAAARRLSEPGGPLSWSTIAEAHLELYQRLRGPGQALRRHIGGCGPR